MIEFRLVDGGRVAVNPAAVVDLRPSHVQPNTSLLRLSCGVASVQHWLHTPYEAALRLLRDGEDE